MPSTIAIMIVILILGIAVDVLFGRANQAIRRRWGLDQRLLTGHVATAAGPGPPSAG